jgi:hypothetical protein
MPIEATDEFAATVEAGDHLTLHIYHLTLRVDPPLSGAIVPRVYQ